MNIDELTPFFMWCTIINGGILALWTVLYGFMPDLVYRLQCKIFLIPRDVFNMVIYSFLGLFEILFLIFNVIPYIALLIIG